MPDYTVMMKAAREDTQCAMEVWAEELPKILGSRLVSVYAKGSALKQWESHIDYVPIISDVDIHINIKDDKPLFGSSEADFDAAVDISRQWEAEFIRRRPDHLHIPRMQVIETRFLKALEKYTPPRPQDIQNLYGEPHLGKIPDTETIRVGDLSQIFEEREFIDDLPRRILDRTGFDWWAIIRVMTWRISPSPVRLLSQTHPDPIDLWSWNRTKIHELLLNEGYDKLAKHYHGFYDAGWRLYLSEFKGLEEFRETAIHGYYVLKESLNLAQRLRA